MTKSSEERAGRRRIAIVIVLLAVILTVGVGSLLYLTYFGRAVYYTSPLDANAAETLARSVGLRAALAPASKPLILWSSFLIGGPLAGVNTTEVSWWAKEWPPLSLGADKVIVAPGNSCPGTRYYIGTGKSGETLIAGADAADTQAIANSYPNCPTP